MRISSYRINLLNSTLTAGITLLGGSSMTVAQTAPADRVYVNAKVWTGEIAAPAAEAFAVRGDRLVAVGTSARVRETVGPKTVVIDLQGQRVVPGFNDSHWHLPTRAQVDIADAGSVAEMQKRLRAQANALAPTAWLLGRGWGAADFPNISRIASISTRCFPIAPCCCAIAMGIRCW